MPAFAIPACAIVVDVLISKLRKKKNIWIKRKREKKCSHWFLGQYFNYFVKPSSYYDL